jgi:cytochrome c-type biogenesis protein CcmH/NrfG
VVDTSREGRYHNLRFVTAAEELGLEVAESATRGWGWADTSVPQATARMYDQQLAELDNALATHPVAAPPAKQAGAESRSRLLPATCACTPARRIRVTRTVLDLGEITCNVCGEAFTVPE